MRKSKFIIERVPAAAKGQEWNAGGSHRVSPGGLLDPEAAPSAPRSAEGVSAGHLTNLVTT